MIGFESLSTVLKTHSIIAFWCHHTNEWIFDKILVRIRDHHDCLWLVGEEGYKVEYWRFVELCLDKFCLTECTVHYTHAHTGLIYWEKKNIECLRKSAPVYAASYNRFITWHVVSSIAQYPYINFTYINFTYVCGHDHDCL